jgi:predicted metal-dependent HD superfamily phosphohydrolase
MRWFRQPPLQDRVPVLAAPERWRERWGLLLEWLGLPPVFLAAGERLLARYSEPGRHYHDASHILACLDALEAYPDPIDAPDEVELALWYHDAVYDPQAGPGSNELASAEYFRREFGELAAGRIATEEVAGLILATRHRPGPPGPRDAGLVADIDLAILGAPPARYRSYRDAVRREFSFLDDTQWETGRRAFIRQLLGREWLYHTRHYRRLSEDQARANLRIEFESLGSR